MSNGPAYAAPAIPVHTVPGATPEGEVSFPRQNARTQRFTLGAPRAFTVAPDGSRVVFLRTRSGTDRAGCLWVLDVAEGADLTADAPGHAPADAPGRPPGHAPAERLVADPVALLTSGPERLSAQERARRERTREAGAGIVGYATDREVRRAAFALSSQLFVVDLHASADPPDATAPAGARRLETATPVLDPRLDPTGRHIAYVADGALRVVEAEGGSDRALLELEGETVTWGLAEFVASEEMGRHRGYWWSPDGTRLLAARVDDSPVQLWHLADPANPSTPPTAVRYPAAGTANADVSLVVVSLDGSRTEVSWQRAAYPYLVAVHWSEYGPPILLVQSRDQRASQVLAVDPGTGATSLVHEDRDPAWLEIVAGVPAWLPDGRLVRTVDSEGARRLVLGEQVVTPASLQVSSVLHVGESGVLVAATDEPTEMHLWAIGPDGSLTRRTTDAGVHSGRCGGDVLVVSTASLDRFGAQIRVFRGNVPVAEVVSYAETPVLIPTVGLLRSGLRELRSAVLLPTGWEPGSGKLPVLLDPYGGPGAQRVVTARNAYLSAQWFADQGFAVVIADGRGTPSRGPEWERAVAFDLAGPVLDDQVDALHGVAEQFPDLDLSRVAIRGWSFGGYLAALAVLRRPDVFSAAVAGAPVTDWALYDTHYTERYLGMPKDSPEAYARSSLLGEAAKLARPLLLIHGLADDNVVAAHTLRLSSALLAAGRPHTVLPLSGVTHMTPDEVVAENLLLLQVAFLHEALGTE